MVAPISFDIVLPCHNPQSDWDNSVIEDYRAIKSTYRDNFKSLIIVNDGSTCKVNSDHLKKTIPELVWLDYPTNQGKGYALRHGVARSTSEVCFYTDIDFPFGNKNLLPSLNKLQEGNDVVMGIRDNSYYEKLPIKRWIISHLTNVMTRLLLGIPYRDTQAGFKGFNNQGRKLFLSTTLKTFLFDTEFILMAHRNKLKISTVSVTPSETVRFSSMNSVVLKKEFINFITLMKR